MKRIEVLKEINRNIYTNLKIRENLYRGKTFVVVGSYIETSFKTKRGAEGYIKRESNVSWYDEMTFEMVCAGDGLEIFEIKENEILNAENNKLMWYLEIKRYFNDEGRYSEIERQAERIITDANLKEYVFNTLKDLRSQGEHKSLKIYECRELLEDKKEEYENSLKHCYNDESLKTFCLNELKEINSKLEKYTEAKINEIAAIQEENTTVLDQEITVNYNEEKQGIELIFNNKPSEEVRTKLKENGFRWHRVKKVWYAKDTEERKTFVNSLIAPGVEEVKEENKTDIQDNKIILNSMQEGKIYTVNFTSTKTFENIEITGEVRKVGVNKKFFYNVRNGVKLEKEKQIYLSSLLNCAKNIKIEEVAPEEPASENKKVSFEGVAAQEVKENIIVKCLVPAINKNCTKEENDKYIDECSSIDTFKVSHIVNLTVDQYEKFINTFLTDYNFLQSLGGYEEDENGKYLYSYGVLITAQGKENLVVDPSGYSYARYVCRIIEGEQLEKINVKADGDFKKQLEKIQDDKFYIYNANKKEVITDDRIILNRAINDLTIISGHTIKEMIEEGKNINIYTLEMYTGNLKAYKERLNADICILFGDDLDNAISKIDFIERLETEIKRAGIKAA